MLRLSNAKASVIQGLIALKGLRTTLGSGIVVLVGIIVLVGTFARINKRTGVHFYRSVNLKKLFLSSMSKFFFDQ